MLANIARNIWLVTSIHDIKLSVIHIARHRNTTADLLSRWENSEVQNCKLNQSVPNFVWQHVPRDIFHLNLDI